MSTANKALVSDQGLHRGAGDENRTRALSLGISGSWVAGMGLTCVFS
ncbi:hypothetical protein SPW_6466 [Streptomyces sp. W007]|nr:hypothetical protein SPW_6466 [Streptomyces sp. W007]